MGWDRSVGVEMNLVVVGRTRSVSHERKESGPSQGRTQSEE